MKATYQYTLRVDANLPNTVYFPSWFAAHECVRDRRAVAWLMTPAMMRKFAHDNTMTDFDARR